MHSRLAPRQLIVAAFALAVALALTAVASGAPSLTIDSGPNGHTRDTTPSFTFSTDAGAIDVKCSIDQGTPDYVPCTGASAHTSLTPLADGDYTFRVRAIDEIPEETVATREFTVDTAAPTLTLLSGPAEPVNDNTPSFGFSGEAGALLECSVDQGTASWSPCSSADAHDPPTLADGGYTFRVRATDAAGNATTRTRGFSVDTLAPTTTIDSAPLGTTDDQSLSFAFSASEGSVSFECRFDGPTFTACGSPKSYDAVAAGAHTFAVRATDAVGNVGAEDVESFTIDLTNPTLAIVSGPEGATNESDPAFGFNAEGGTVVECSIDQGPASYGPCSATSSHSAGALADGAYTFRVRATDVLGRVTEREQAFTIDTVAPTTAIGSGPAGPSNDASPSFAFSSNEAGVSFECRRDAEVSFAPCESPKAYANLPDGNHSFHVRASDAAGNTAAVVSRAFSIDTVAPTVTIGFGPSGTTSDDSPFFEFTAAGQAAVECSIDQGAPSFGACSSGASHVVAQRLAAGSYTFRVRASDLAGNATVATRAFTVATGTSAPPPSPPTTPPPPATPPTVAATPQLMSPFPLVRLSGQLTTTGAKVKTLSVRAPAGAMIRVRVTPRCAKGARCPVKSSASKVSQTGLARFKRLELGYRAGTTIEIRVSQTGRIGKYTRFTIRRGKGPQRLDRCLMPGTTRASTCPAA